jgi:hypothetical protein
VKTGAARMKRFSRPRHRHLRQIKARRSACEEGTRADPRARPALTDARTRNRQTARMDEPTHANESAFWDQVADWLLGTHALDHGPMSQDDIQAILRGEDQDLDPH